MLELPLLVVTVALSGGVTGWEESKLPARWDVSVTVWPFAPVIPMVTPALPGTRLARGRHPGTATSARLRWAADVWLALDRVAKGSQGVYRPQVAVVLPEPARV